MINYDKISNLDSHAMKLLQEENDVELYNLGLYCMNKEHKRYSIKKAIEYLEYSSQFNNIKAMYELTNLYNIREFKNTANTRKLLEALYESNYLDSRFRLGKFYLKKGNEKGMEILEACVLDNNISSINFLGEYYFFKEDYSKAITYFEKGALLNDPTSIEYAFHMYKYEIGIESDDSKYKLYLNKLDSSINEYNSEVYELKTLIKLKQFNKALELTDDFEYTKKRIIAFFYKGLIYKELNDTKLSKQNFLSYINECKSIIAKGDKISSSKEKMLKIAIKNVDDKLYDTLGAKFSKKESDNITTAKNIFDSKEYIKAINFIEKEEKKKLSSYELNNLLQLKARCYLELNDINSSIKTFEKKSDLFNKVNFGYINILINNNYLDKFYTYLKKVEKIDTSTKLRVCLTLNKFNYINDSKAYFNKIDLSNLKESDKKMIKTLKEEFK